LFKTFLLAALVASASAYAPAMPGTKLSQSKFAGARASYAAPVPATTRSSDATMSAITRRDADGNPITNYDYFDPIWVGILLLPWVALLVTNPF